MKYLAAGLFLFFAIAGYTQKHPSVQVLQDSIPSSFRGLSVLSDNIVWVSGSNGTVGRSTDAGRTWQWIKVPGFEKRDFRDIEAFDSSTAIIMAVDNPADILKTTDGGKNWKIVFHKEQEGMFLDAMDFKYGDGICVGDPVMGKDSVLHFFIIQSNHHGDTWSEYEPYFNPIVPKQSEGIFAGSGSNILFYPGQLKYAFITGGTVARLLGEWPNHMGAYEEQIPIMQGMPSAGAFSVCFAKKTFYITGGDYSKYEKDSGNVVYTRNYGISWQRSSTHGYRSCIIQIHRKTFITCGTNGVDMSFDGCKTWKLIYGDGAKGTDGFNVCAKSKKGKAVYFAGSGRIAKLIL